MMDCISKLESYCARLGYLSSSSYLIYMKIVLGSTMIKQISHYVGEVREMRVSVSEILFHDFVFDF